MRYGFIGYLAVALCGCAPTSSIGRPARTDVGWRDGEAVNGLAIGIRIPTSARSPIRYSVRLKNVSEQGESLGVINFFAPLFAPNSLIVKDGSGQPVQGFNAKPQVPAQVIRNLYMEASGRGAIQEEIAAGGRILQLDLPPGDYTVQWRYALPPSRYGNAPRPLASALDRTSQARDWSGEVFTPEVNITILPPPNPTRPGP